MTVDPRALAARDHHVNAAVLDARASAERRKRDALVRELRAEDKRAWSYMSLARAVGCSKELIACIIRPHPQEEAPG